MSAFLIFFIFIQALLCVNCSGGNCVGEWSTLTTRYRTLTFNEDSYVYVSCKNKGLKVNGKETIKCIDGKLPTYLPQCVLLKASCEPLNAPVFGSIRCSATAPAVRSSCNFECQNTHYLKGSSTRTCTEDLRWTGSAARCFLKSECPEPPPLYQGTVSGCSPERKPKYNDTCYFRCNEGYRLVGPSYVKCRLNGRLTDEKGHQSFPSCEPSVPTSTSVPGDKDLPSKSLSVSCQVYNGYCSHHCHQEPKGVRCSCRSGYLLSPDGKTCIDVDECRSGRINKCDHICRNTVGSFKCLCRQGYTSSDGFRCEKMVDPLVEKHLIDSPQPVARLSCQLQNGYCFHICHQETEGVRCSCRRGYHLARDGKTCIDEDECRNGTLNKCDHVCRNTPGGYQCLCREGHFSPDGFRCEDVNECSDDKLNKCDHICQNTVGSYTCSCRAGFVSPDGFMCEGCRVNSYRTASDATCRECPAHSHTDGDGKTSVSDCICNPGFVGNPAQGIPCTDIDECSDGEKFGCSHNCINNPGSAHCACPLGYQLKEDKKTCTDIDECRIKNGGCDGVCHNTVGNFSCSCPEGFVAYTNDKYRCDDVDECAEGNGGCSGECVNFQGGFHCFCSEGHHLHPDGKSCIPVRCPRVAVPHHSKLKCKKSKGAKDRDIFSPGEMPEDKEFPVGAACRIKCDKGYDFRGSDPVIVCQNDGKWNASLPECRVLQCLPLTPPLNGDVYPASCKDGSTTVKQKCFFTCRPGYRITGQEVLTCRNDLTWSKRNTTQCVPETEVSISCPDDDITIELTSDEGWAKMQLNSPRTTLAAGLIRVRPEWVSLDRASVFPAGETEVTFSVNGDNKTAECSISVVVLDKHPPVFPKCPDTLFVTSSPAGTEVNWEEPVPQDNVGVATVSKNLEPNSFLRPGLHFVEYIALDFAGNVGQCIFHINITAGGCKDLLNPENGEANCQEWMLGKICQPTCFDNYTRPSELFACDESGTWTPSNFISPCLPE